jgi:exopolysaccharide/PEP-CTERM locus tyrosine autokinase
VSVIENAINKLRRDTAPGTTLTGTGAQAAAEAAVPGTSEPEDPLMARHLALDLRKLREAGYLPEETEERRFADFYRALKRPIIRKALAGDAGHESRFVLVSSPLPGEGKTFTTLNLALSMARERDISVLLIDGDFPKAHLSRVLGVEKEPGLLDAVADETLEIEPLIFRTDAEGLEFLSAGTRSEGASELLASQRMGHIAAKLTARNSRRIIVLDSSPLLVSTEARVLAHIAGQMIVVARSGHTPRQALIDAIALVDKKKLNGLVLNDAYVTSSAEYYGYSYYYGARGTGQTADRG